MKILKVDRWALSLNSVKYWFILPTSEVLLFLAIPWTGPRRESREYDVIWGDSSNPAVTAMRPVWTSLQVLAKVSSDYTVLSGMYYNQRLHSMFVPVSQHIFHVLNLPLQLSRHNSLLWSCATKMTISKTNRPGPGSIREMGQYGKWVFSELAKRWEFGGQEWHWFCHMWAKSV